MELELAICWVIFSFRWNEIGYTPGGNAEDFENKRVAGKAIRKTMKTKGRQTRGADAGRFEFERPSTTCRLTSGEGRESRGPAGFRTITIHFTLRYEPK